MKKGGVRVREEMVRPAPASASRPVLVVEWLPHPSQATEPEHTKHHGCTTAVHAGTLSVLDAHGVIGGYAFGVWLRWWYEREYEQQ